VEGKRGSECPLKSVSNIDFNPVVSALLFLLVNGQKGEAYNIANSNLNLHLKDFANELATMFGKKVVYDLPDDIEAAGYSKVTKALLDTKKINDLGWTAPFDRARSLQHTVEILRSELNKN